MISRVKEFWRDYLNIHSMAPEGICGVKYDLMGSHYPFEVSMEPRVVP